MQAEILVLDHDPAGLDRLRDIDRLVQIERGRDQRSPQLRPRARWARTRCNRSGTRRRRRRTRCRAAARTRSATSQLRQRCASPRACLQIEAELDLGLYALQRHRVVDVGNLEPAVEGDRVVVGPFVDAHLLAHEIGHGIGASPHVLAAAESVDRDRGLMAVGDRGDDVLGAEGGVAAEEDVRQARLEGDRSTAGRPSRPKARPMSLSIQGKAFSWPTAISTSSHSIRTSGSPVGHEDAAPALVLFRLHLLEYDAGQPAAFMVNAFGARKFRIATPSRIASSFSQGEAFISAKPERTTTLTSAPPRRSEVRQQSIAVLPPPSTTTRRPIDEIWPNDTLESQSMPIWMLARRFPAPGNVEIAPARRAAADENRVVAFGDQRLEAVDAPSAYELTAESRT